MFELRFREISLNQRLQCLTSTYIIRGTFFTRLPNTYQNSPDQSLELITAQYYLVEGVSPTYVFTLVYRRKNKNMLL